MTTSPLAGIRVLDLSRVLAGPFCAMTLGDLGAHVIKVERPGSGDETRGWGPPFDEAGQSAYFLSTNRNKLSLSADFAAEADRRLVTRLIADADVVIENFLPGALARYGLDKVALLAQHERLIWCTISGFGPDSSRPGYDFVVQAESGWMAITGPEHGPPTKVGVALVDVMAGKDAAIAILAALAGRERGAPADRNLNISLFGTAAAALVNVAQNTLVTGNDARRWGNAHPNLVPYQLFDAADRPMVVAVGSDHQWIVATTALGLDSLAQDERLRTNAGRLANREEIVSAIGARIAERSASEWIERLSAAGVPCGLVRSVKEALQGVQASPRTGVASAVGGSVRLSPPRLGEHDELIRTFQWSAFDHMPILAST
jgi:crotonobetainyl-CoA:carnitine CoA-transferase CaiB-like acyl-CoA transferase